MRFGIPILTSDRDFARHLCGDAAIYFDPLDAKSVAKAMATIIEDAMLRRRLVEEGRKTLAQAPTWDEIAGRFVDVLERAARGQLPIRAESQSEPEIKCAPVSPVLQVRRLLRGSRGDSF
jgi:hypothetical protein